MYKRIIMSLIIVMGLFTGACQKDTTFTEVAQEDNTAQNLTAKKGKITPPIIATVDFNESENQFEATDNDTGETVALCNVPTEYPYIIHVKSIVTNPANNSTATTFEYIPNPFYDGNCGSITSFGWDVTKYQEYPSNSAVQIPQPTPGTIREINPILNTTFLDPTVPSTNYTSTNETITITTSGEQGWFATVSFEAVYNGCGAITTNFETLENLGNMAPVSGNILFCSPFDDTKLTVSLIIPGTENQDILGN